ncbi:MAG: ATP phosphoribosyltransferase regulatory subunit [Rhodobacteraceae bacterium]|nr:ATP phosphoribosyltransferase regulatory subunit [Paracoccaceae bacterium]
MTTSPSQFDAKIEAALELFKDAGHRYVQPPLLQPADVFLDLVGEDIRRRLFLTTGAHGADLCMRPDFTIPVCREHLANGAASRKAAYFYNGLVFRQRSEGSGEIPQIGAESIGRDDFEAADADMLALAVSSLETFGISTPEIRIGDEALFVALLEGLSLPKVWQRRLRDLFGDGERLADTLNRMGGQAPSSDDNRDIRLGFLSALNGADPSSAKAVVEDLLSIAGISAVGGRSPGEIAERFLEQATLASGDNAHSKAAETIRKYLEIEGPADDVVAELKAFAKTAKIDLDAPIAAYEARLKAVSAKGLDVSKITFAASFGRRLDYYTGFIFEIHAAHNDNAAGRDQLVGGGRYDKLARLLGADAEVPAVGFSIWLDRLSLICGAGA